MKRFIVFLFITMRIALSLPYWGPEDFRKAEAFPKGMPVMQQDIMMVRGDWQSWSYIHELCQTAAFIASMQVTDSLDPEFGGIIEGENALTVVETDNTQEAIWVWCRYYEITSDTSYFLNIRRAWIYIMNHPAYLEEGTDSDYYRVWNCGLALFGESKYRSTFGDSSYMWYADTCAQYILHHALPFTGVGSTYLRLHPKVTSFAAGMLYQYGKEINNQAWKDTALLYGERVQDWIEDHPSTNINDEVWAMSGGTAVWGICRSSFDADTAAGIAWLNTYIDSMKYFQPTGQWCNSWNIWYANAYNRVARILQSGTHVEYHHALTDSLLVQDFDNDGGVPPTRGWNQNQDHSWVSAYMVFMGFEGLMDSIRNYDAGINGICAAGPRLFFLAGDTINIGIKAANYGFLPLSDVYLEVGGSYSGDTVKSFDIGEEDTLWFETPWIPSDTGYYDFDAYCLYAGDERTENDTFHVSLYVRPLRLVSGMLVDSTSGAGIFATLYFQFIDETAVYFDSTVTDSNTGIFNILLIDSLYRAVIYTDVPYPDSVHEDIYVTPDSVSLLDFYLNPTDLAIINRDNEARYAEYYTGPLDSLNLTYKVWAPIHRGVFPVSRIDEFNFNTIIWYTGDAEFDNVTAEEQESLMVFLDSGNKLLLTGQNIGEEISGTPFFTNYLHAQLINDSIHEFKCFPDTLDALGQSIGKLYTVGVTGAQNQYSRDAIASDGFSHEFLYYDSLLTDVSAVWYNDPVVNYQTIYCGFGIEAVHKPSPWVGYMTRTNLLGAFLNWFGVVGIEERVGIDSPTTLFALYPNPARNRLHIYAAYSLVSERVAVKIYDAIGRLVKTLFKEKARDELIWDLRDANDRHVSNGVYFVRLEAKDRSEVKKTIILR
ncbi:MAG: T9SS type A sorting domain-containing protein [candidate division WOR-3 bacterium]|nr:MAG: T9SS type A sorting domain-containing protein [candidate division WOR-3 bacterium]